MHICSHLPFCQTQRFFILFFAFLLCSTYPKSALAGGPEYFNPNPGKPFVFALGVGYGYSNNPSLNNKDEQSFPGITFSGSLGYRLGKRFKIDFGPTVWIKAADMFNNSLPSGERTSNKRMLVSFNGYYLLHKRIPVTLKLGAGVGSMVYSPERATVIADGKKNDPTEYFSGPAATAGLVYQLKLSDKITIHPSVNFWYTDLKKQKIEYVSAVDHQMPSLSGDMRLSVLLNF